MVYPILILLVVLLVLLAPFFLQRGEQLQDASSVNSPEKLEAIKQSLLKRYLEDEEAHRQKLISDGVWVRRKRFLTTRYIDAARRLDYIRYLEKQQNQPGGGA